jgi:hypothetical protein
MTLGAENIHVTMFSHITLVAPSSFALHLTVCVCFFSVTPVQREVPPRVTFAALFGAALAVPTIEERGSRHTSPEDTYTTDVVILGAGSAGTYAAIQLKVLGKKVLVVEMEDHLGDHTNTYVDKASGAHFNLGVLVFYKIQMVFGYFKSLNVPLAGSSNSPLNTTYFDFDKGKSVPSFAPSRCCFTWTSLEVFVL